MTTPIFMEDESKRKWWLVDADGQVLGRLASRIAVKLIGKDKPVFAPHQDHGDHVVVVNAEKIRVTGRKTDAKTYFSHSSYPGGSHVIPYRRLLQQKPAEILRRAVKGMIKNKSPLGRRIFRKLHVYAGPVHPHASQKPAVFTW